MKKNLFLLRDLLRLWTIKSAKCDCGVKNVCIDKLDNTVNKNSNTYHKTIKMRPIDVKTNTYIDFDNDTDPNFKAGNHARI